MDLLFLCSTLRSRLVNVCTQTAKSINGAKYNPMSERIIPLHDERTRHARPFVPTSPILAKGLITDQLKRPLRDLRISVTDRCNFRCQYCMPKEVFDTNYKYLPHADLLSFEEIARLSQIFVNHGVKKLRLTGGEPLLRKNIEILIAQLSQIKTPDASPLDLTLTTNGSLLTKKARALKDAGLKRITVSLDAMSDEVFKIMNDVDYPVQDVLAGIQSAQNVGLGRDAQGHFSGLKINMVVKRGTNDQEILPMVRYFHGKGMSLRFIEYMDVGSTNGWKMQEVLPSSELLERVGKEFDLQALDSSTVGETAKRFGFKNQSGRLDPSLGEIGVISSVTQAFCGDCNRARLSTEGQLYMCLFASKGFDLKSLLRTQASDEDITSAIAHLWGQRDDRYSERRALQNNDLDMPPSPSGHKRVEMSYIGG